MSTLPDPISGKSRLAVLLEHLATIDDPRDVHRIAHPLAEIRLLVVCGTIADCDDYDHITAWVRPLARSARPRRHRRQDLAAKPRPHGQGQEVRQAPPQSCR